MTRLRGGGRASASPEPRGHTVRLAAAVLGLLLVAGCRTDATPDPSSVAAEPAPGVVLVVIDCLRADHVGTYGYHRATTPNLDRLAADSVLFERPVSASNLSRPSVASLLTGTRVSRHGVGLAPPPAPEERSPAAAETTDPPTALPADRATLGEALRRAGFATAAFTNPVDPQVRAEIDRGHDVHRTEPNDAAAIDSFESWLGQLDNDLPFLAYLQLSSPCFPFTPPDHLHRFSELVGERRIRQAMERDVAATAQWIAAGEISEEDRREVEALYDGELLAVDDTLGRVLAALRARGRYDDSFVVLTASHGQALWEHGAFGFGGHLLWDEVVRVPLLMKLPGGRHAGRRVADTVRTIDVLPTLLGALEQPARAELDGFPLLARTRQGLEIRIPDEPAVAETPDPHGPRALYVGALKYVFDGGPERPRVYDLATDPAEERDLANELAPWILGSARATLERILSR